MKPSSVESVNKVMENEAKKPSKKERRRLKNERDRAIREATRDKPLIDLLNPVGVKRGSENPKPAEEPKCSKKISYTTKELADKHLTKIILNASNRNIPRRSYLCEHCGSYHLTSWRKIQHTRTVDEKSGRA